LRIFIRKHPVFERRGDDLYAKLKVPLTTAILGGEIEFLTLEKEKIFVKIPQGTESGKILKIKGKGIPHFGGYGRGDLYLRVEIKIPKKLTRKQRELLEKLKEEGL